MKRARIALVLLAWIPASTGQAGYTIDGRLYDWGVDPFSHWAPNPPAHYTETDNVNLYGASPYQEYFDFEAMYFDDDGKNFYLAVVSSYPLTKGAGDLGIDLNGDMTISANGVVTGLDYAMHIETGSLGKVVSHPTWSATDFLQGSPFEASGGTYIGTALVAIVDDPEMEEGTYILEAAIPRDLFPGGGGGPGDFLGAHLTMWCGNDSINLIGDIDTTFIPPPPPVIPAPGAIALGSLGVALVGWLRKSRTLA